MRTFLIFFLTIIFSLAAVRNSAGQETSDFSFLTINLDPAAVGSGSAGVAEGEGVPALFYNPALLNSTRAWSTSFVNRNYQISFLDINHYVAGGAFRLNDKSALAVYLQRESSQSSQIYSTESPPTALPRDYQAAVAVAFAHRFSPKFQAGISAKYLRASLTIIGQKLIESSWAVDLGVRWRNVAPGLTITAKNHAAELFRKFAPRQLNRGLSIGVAILNMGPRVSFIDAGQEEPIPQTLRAGLAYHLFSSPMVQLTGLFDFEKLMVRKTEAGTDSPLKALFTSWKGKAFREATYHFGGKLKLGYILSLRYGYQYQPFRKFDSKGVSTYGVGLDLKYVSLQYGRWIAPVGYEFYHNSNVLSIRIKDIKM